MQDQRLGLQDGCIGVRVRGFVRGWRGRGRECEFLDSRPGEVDVEEEEEDAQAHDRAVEFVVGAFELVEEEVSIDLGDRVSVEAGELGILRGTDILAV